MYTSHCPCLTAILYFFGNLTLSYFGSFHNIYFVLGYVFQLFLPLPEQVNMSFINMSLPNQKYVKLTTISRLNLLLQLLI